MRQHAVVAGVGMTSFGKHMDRSLADLAHEAIGQALIDANLPIERIQAAWAGNAAAGLIVGQVCIAGQAILRGLGAGRIPVVNVENACATASTAFQQACTMVTVGAYDAVLAFGVEKLHHSDRGRVLEVFSGCVDVDAAADIARYISVGQGANAAPQPGRQTVFIDLYARMARDYMERTGATAYDFASISAKNSRHGALNPLAQYRDVLTPDGILASRMVSSPLTLPMCSPIGDGAAAAVIVSHRLAAQLGITSPVKVLSSIIASGFDSVDGGAGVTKTIAREAYGEAAVDPADVDCVELHDAAASAELALYEELDLCAAGEGPALLAEGATEIGGRVPVNVSGGLMRKGHPIGATGLAQIYELVLQLRGRAGARQVDGARLALAENGGGFLRGEPAAIAMTLLSR